MHNNQQFVCLIIFVQELMRSMVPVLVIGLCIKKAGGENSLTTKVFCSGKYIIYLIHL